MSGVVTLNRARIREKVQETAAVAALLGSVFAEEEVAPQPVTGKPSLPATGSLAFLTTEQVALLTYLGGKSSWQREELEAFAEARGTLLDGALEALNEAALDRLGEDLIEGEDPLDVSLDVWKELMK